VEGDRVRRGRIPGRRWWGSGGGEGRGQRRGGRIVVEEQRKKGEVEEMTERGDTGVDG
jgi:hypothetical protein